MSRLTYIAGDQPFRKIENPHIRMRSIRQALAEGIRLPNWMTMEMLEGKDWDKPDFFMSFTEEYTGEEFTILPFDKSCFLDEIYTEKVHCAYYDWHNTETYTAQTIAYIQECLQETDEIELWNIWLGGAWLEADDDTRPNLKSSRTREAEEQDTWDDWKLHKIHKQTLLLHQLSREVLDTFFCTYNEQKCLVVRK